MKMLEDLAEVVRNMDETSEQEGYVQRINADMDAKLAAQFIRTHHATIRDMAARLEASERDAARYQRLKYDTKIFENYWAEEYLPGEEIDARVDQLIGPDTAMQETGR